MVTYVHVCINELSKGQKNCHYENRKCSMAKIITVWKRGVAVLKVPC